MADFTYHVPDPPTRPFRRGQMVTVVDSQGLELSEVKVTRGGKIVQTSCGRWWTPDGWRWSEGRRWPFPTIKHKNG